MNSAAGNVANGARTIPSRAMRREYTASAVAVIVVAVGRVRVLVLHRAGRMRMAVRLRNFPALVRLLVMLVVDVNVRAARMVMEMHVSLANQEPGAERHHHRRAREADGRPLAEQKDSPCRAEERRGW